MHIAPIDFDPVGQRLRALQAAIDNLKETDIRRLYGDSVLIASAAIQVHSLAEDLTKIAKEIVSLHPQAAE